MTFTLTDINERRTVDGVVPVPATTLAALLDLARRAVREPLPALPAPDPGPKVAMLAADTDHLPILVVAYSTQPGRGVHQVTVHPDTVPDLTRWLYRNRRRRVLWIRFDGAVRVVEDIHLADGARVAVIKLGPQIAERIEAP